MPERGIAQMDKDLRILAEKVLRRETNRILKEIERMMKEDGVEEAIANGGRGKEGKKNTPLGQGQFKKLMDAAGEASCIEEILLFLGYQASKGGGWKKQCRNEKSIAEYVAESFGAIQGQVYPMIEKERGKDKISAEDERELRLKIAEKYFGYLYWKAHIVSKS